MTPPLRSVLTAAFATLLLAACRPGDAGVPGGTGESAQAPANDEVYVDLAYAFEIHAPSSGWTWFEASEGMGSEVRGIRHTSGAGILVRAGAFPGANFDQIMRQYASAFPSDAQIETVEFGGHRALRARYVRSNLDQHVVHTIFARDDHVVQLITLVPTSSNPDNALALQTAYIARPGPITAAPPPSPKQATGIGWRIHAGHHESLVSGWRYRATDEARLMVGNDLRAAGSPALHVQDAAMAEVVLTVDVHRVPPQVGETMVGHVRDYLVSQFGPALGEAATHTVAGRPLAFTRHRAQGIDRLMALDLDGSRIRRVELSFPSGEDERALALLANLESLSAEELAALWPTLLREVPRQRCLGETRSSYGGVVREFEAGLSWTAPPGFWDLCADPQQLGEHVVLAMEEVEQGTSIEVEFDPAPSQSIPEALDAFAADRTIHEHGTLEVGHARLTWQLGAGPAGGGLELHALAEHDGRRLRWTQSASRDTPELRVLMSAALAGLRADPELAPLELVGDRLIDHRYAVSVRGPAGASQPKVGSDGELVWRGPEGGLQLSTEHVPARDHARMWSRIRARDTGDQMPPWVELEIAGSRAWSLRYPTDVVDAIERGSWSHVLVYEDLDEAEIAAIRSSVELL